MTCGCGGKEDNNFVIGGVLVMDYVFEDGDETRDVVAALMMKMIVVVFLEGRRRESNIPLLHICMCMRCWIIGILDTIHCQISWTHVRGHDGA